MAQNQIRSFIAIDLSPDVLKNIEQLVNKIKKRIGVSVVRWVPVGNIHLTLKFLGDVPANQVEALSSAMQMVAAEQPGFDLELEGLGAFPKISQPRVIWVGVKQSQELLTLQKKIEQQMALLGFAQEDRPFIGHLTLGRVSERCNKQELTVISETIRDSQVGTLGSSRIGATHLYQSDLRPSGSVYTCLFTVNFKQETTDTHR